MIDSNRVLPVAILGVLVILSGCTAAIAGDDPVEFEADAAGVDSDTLAETNYEFISTTENTLNHTVTLGNEERTVVITNQITTYETRGDTVASTGVFTVVSTPSASIIGQPVNPIARMSNEQIVSTISEVSDKVAISDIEKVDEYTLEINGTDSTVTKYDGTTTIEGVTVDVHVYLTTVEIGDDTVIAVGVTPQQSDSVPDDEIDTLMQGLTHIDPEAE